MPEDEDEALSDRTNLFRSDIYRLSNKRIEPNVAVRKREFETLEIENNKDYRRERDRRQQRESRSLDHSGKNHLFLFLFKAIFTYYLITNNFPVYF